MISPQTRTTYSSKPRTCDELGLCQGLKPSCPGCTCHDTRLLPNGANGGHYFAPGAIEGGAPTHEELKRAGVRPLWRMALRATMAITVLGSCGYALVYVALKLGAIL